MLNQLVSRYCTAMSVYAVGTLLEESNG
jgi:hypothetical protein